jgi:predicted TIM-barrel fold metal-dependent hydrolase
MTRGLLALARKHRLPVLLHIEWTRLREFEQLLREHRDVTVIWAHGGYTPLFVAQRLLAAHPNLVYELSARTWAEHPRSPEYTLLRDGRTVWPQWLALIEREPTRFIVGTDASHRSQASEEMKAASVQALLRQLSPATREAVARGNLRRLLSHRTSR